MMERLKTTKKTWWTRKIGRWTVLCFYTTVSTPLSTQQVLTETIIGRPQLRWFLK